MPDARECRDNVVIFYHGRPPNRGDGVLLVLGLVLGQEVLVGDGIQKKATGEPVRSHVPDLLNSVTAGHWGIVRQLALF